MAGGSLFIWIPFLLSCVFQASDNRYVCRGVYDSNDDIKNPETDHISQIPITLPEGIDPKNINITSITIKTCTDMREQLEQLNIQLQQTNLRNSHLDNEAFGLRREVRQLNLQLATCSATASAITGSYQTQLLNKMKQLLETFDSDTFLILKIIALTREVNTLQKKIKRAANATETSEIGVLQREQQEKINELNVKTQQMESSHPNSALILQIISLQNQIWDKERAQSRRGETNLQPDNNILALQGQLDRKISELRAKEDADSAMLELISVHTKITVMQRLISVHIERSRASAADYQRQWKQKAELLRRKIVQLNREESNTELTKEILFLQTEVEHFRQLMLNAKKTTESQIKELRVILEEEKKQQANLQKHLEETDYAQSQLIMKFISVMKEVRELDDDEQHHTTSTSQATTLQTLLQAKEKEFAIAQAEINELQRKLQLKSKECSGFEERYEVVKTEIEQKIVELNRTRNSKAALILNVINLHGDLKTLRDLISAASDPDRISELQRQLEEKQEELNSKTADMERLIPNPKIILTIIELQNNIWDLQKKAANDSTGDDVKDLQDRVKGLISELDDNGDDDNAKLMLTIITLQSQVEQLQRQLPTTLVTQLTDDLKIQLQKYVNELNEKNQTTARLILTITDLQNQLRNLEKGEHNKDQTASAAITKLREQLKAKVEERIRDQAEIKALQNKLNQTEAQCTGFEHKLKDLQTNLDAKMKELQSKSESVSSLALQVSTLTLQLEELKRQLQNTKSETKINELQKLIDEKNNELARKTEELKASSAQPQRILQIIAIQTQIEKLSYVAANDTDYEMIRALQDHLNNLVDGIQDENNENTKLMFKILAHQDEIARLEKQEKRQTQAALDRIKGGEQYIQVTYYECISLTSKSSSELRKRLELITLQLQDSELRLQEADAKNFNLIMEIADLRTQLKKAQKKTSKPAENSNELEQQLETQQRVNKRLESANKDLNEEVKELKMCCTDDVTHCADLQRQLQQSQEDADRLQQQLREKDANLKQLQQQLEEQITENNRLQNEKNQLEDYVQDLQNRLSNVEDKTIYAKLREQLKAKVEERIRDQAEIKALQNKLNQTEAQCTGFEHKLKDLQTNLDAKMKELQSKSESVSSLALQVSTLTLQLEELKRQLQNTKSETKINELQKLIDEKNNELARKTEELKASSAQPQRILQIIAIQTQIEKLSYVAANDTDYERIRALHDNLNNLVDGIQDENNENTKLMFKILAHQDEIARLEKQEKRQTQAALDRIKDLENELEDIRNQIEEKTLLLDSSDTRIGNLTAQIMELHKKIKPLEDEILNVRDTSTENARVLQKRLELITRQLQDSELRLQEADAKNFNLIMEIADLRTQLKKAQKKTSKPAENSNELEQQLETQQRVNKRLESANKALQNKLNQTEAQCTGFEHKLKDLQTNLDAKMKELQSKSESVSSLALQVSTLTLQLEELKRQLQNTKSETKINELQKLIDEKNNELARKTEELKASSAQPQRILQIIAIQTQIEKLSYVAANDTDYEKIRALHDHLNNLVDGIQDENNENTKLMFKILAHQDEIARLEKQEKRQTQAALDRIKDLENELKDIRNQIEEKTLLLDSSDTRIGNLTAQIMELHKKIKPLEDEILNVRDTSTENARVLQKRLELITRQLQDSELRLQEADAKNFNLIMEIADLRTQLKKAQKKTSKPSENSNELEQQLETQQRVNKRLESANKELREQLKAKVEERIRDQAEIKALQNKLNQTEAQCTGFEHKLKDLQTNLDAKMKELQSKSESVSSLALQVSTLTLQLEELKRQLQNTKSETKINELQKLIDEKNNELARKTEELKASSAQPQRILQIIAIQTQIEKLSYVAANDTDYEKIRALQDHLNNLVDGIQDENNENTKLMFKILAHQDEIARLEKQEKRQTQAALDRIKDLENELDDIRNQIEEKTLLLDSSDTRIANLTAQIMELHKKIKPLEYEILDVRDTSTENARELQKRLELITRQLQDSELRLQEADAKNFNLIMEIADLRTQLKKAQKKASKPSENCSELEQQLQTQQRVNKRLESANKDLKEEVKELKMCCTDDVTHCADLQRQLQQSQEDADRLQQQLREKDANHKQQLEEQITENNRLQNEKNQLEDNVQDLQNRLSNVEDKTIYARQVTLDPNSAHPRIALSADNTRISTTAEAQNVPDNPGRFDVVLAVLGTTGYSTGRHYWEVSVAGKLCYHLGMASESAQRKGLMKFSSANGFWTLVMNKQGQLRAVDRKPFIIPIQTQPLTLGILLDYKKGQISFYDAGARSHMYSFVGQRFTDKIYPFVNFCVEDVEGLTPIELLSPGSVDWIK
ncbi:protein lava lamp [Perca fluviatilis]|uniref:protein lava lamp n=1 Tax=Perca fluviatilis TaxID=8168 RepID=UPI00196373A3|nr:protein lava lamp [Perca fluviatilis]